MQTCLLMPFLDSSRSQELQLGSRAEVRVGLLGQGPYGSPGVWWARRGSQAAGEPFGRVGYSGRHSEKGEAQEILA